MGANAATLGAGLALAIATILSQMLVSHAHVPAASSAAAVIPKGDLLFMQNNMLLATSPEGVKRTQIQLASLQLGPTPSGYPTYGCSKLIEMVYPGVTSADGRFSFNPANFNRPVTKNSTLDKAVLIVTDLIAGKVKHSIEVPPPGLPKGTYFNFQSASFQDNGYDAMKFVAAGSPVGDAYPLFLVVSAWSCKERDSDGQRLEKQFFTKYTYHARTGHLSWSGFRQTIISGCPKEGKSLLILGGGFIGGALGAAGSTGYFVTGQNGFQEGPEDVVVYKLNYKLNSKKLQKVFGSTRPGKSYQYIDHVKLLGASTSGDSVIYAGVYNSLKPPPEIRLFGYAGAQSSPLSGLKFKPDTYISALTSGDGALYAIAKYGGSNMETLGTLVTVYKIGPFALNVTGGKPTPTLSKQVFVLDSKWSGSIEVVGEPVKQLK